MRYALENNKFYAALSRKLGLEDQIVATSVEQRQSDNVLGGVFEAYVGGRFLDMRKVHGDQDAKFKLNAWVDELMKPYMVYYKAIFFTAADYVNPLQSPEAIAKAEKLAEKEIKLDDSDHVEILANLASLSIDGSDPSSPPSSKSQHRFRSRYLS